MTTSVNGQEPPKSPELLELERLTAIAEEKKKISVAEKEAFLAKKELFKGPEITTNSAKITSTGDFIETRVLAHKALSTTLREFVKAFDKTPFTKTMGSQEIIDEGGNKKVNEVEKDRLISFLVHNPADIPQMELFMRVSQQLESLENAYIVSNKAAEEALNNLDGLIKREALNPVLIGSAATGILRTAADIVSLFRTSIDYKTIDLTIDEVSQVAALSDAIKKENKQWKIFYPCLYPINTLKSSSAKASSFMKKVESIKSLNDLSLTQLGKLEQKQKDREEQLAKEVDASKKKEIQLDIEHLTLIISQLKALNASFTMLQTFFANDQQATMNTQVSMMRSEQLVTKLNEGGTYIIKLSMISKGSSKIEESIWRNARITYSGGAELSCLIFAPDGEIVFADSRVYYSPFSTLDKELKG